MTNSQATSATTTISITGMSCGHCVASVERAIRSVEGVAGSKVSIGSAQVDVAADAPDRSAVIAKVTDAVSAAGYPATVAGQS